MGGGSLVGGDDERERLAAALTGCRSGTGGLVLVSGEAGVGKSRLVAEALAAWEGGCLSGTARAGAGPFAPLHEALRVPRAARPGDAARADPTGATGAELSAVLCALARAEPTVLVLEDLHLADAGTLELLLALAEALDAQALLVLGVYRSDELPRTHLLRRLRTDLRRAGRLVDIALRSLSEAQTGELLAALVGGPPAPRLVTAVHERTEGLPLFVAELTTALRDGDGLKVRSGEVDLAGEVVLPLPERVLDAVLARTARLREQHAVPIEWAATLGVQVDLPALATLSGSAGTDALLESGLRLEFDDTIAVFRHALVREALYRTIPWGRRRSHHRQVAELLAARGAAPAVVADHWIAAHAPDHARPLLLEAAEQHCAVHAYREAAALIARALALWPESDDPAGRLAVLERLAECAELSAEPASAATTWADVAQRWRASGKSARRGRSPAGRQRVRAARRPAADRDGTPRCRGRVHRRRRPGRRCCRAARAR